MLDVVDPLLVVDARVGGGGQAEQSCGEPSGCDSGDGSEYRLLHDDPSSVRFSDVLGLSAGGLSRRSDYSNQQVRGLIPLAEIDRPLAVIKRSDVILPVGSAGIAQTADRARGHAVISSAAAATASTPK
jgi:hypothetical protein